MILPSVSNQYRCDKVKSICLYIAGINKLVNVMDTLKNVNGWLFLGLQLGLLHPTLKKIETDYGKVEQCMMEMIAAWLNRQDNVLQIGVPSWSVLQTALRKIGENEVADQICHLI